MVSGSSVNEIDGFLLSEISPIASAWSYRGKISSDHSFNAVRVRSAPKKFLANMDSAGKISHIKVLVFLLFEYGAGSNILGEVVHDQPGKDFLTNKIGLFSVKISQTDRILQLAKGCFDAPAHFIETLEFGNWEECGRKICDQGFK